MSDEKLNHLLESILAKQLNVENAKLQEERSKRKWSMAFKFSMLLYLCVSSGAFIYSMYSGAKKDGLDESHVAVVDILGPIARSGGVNAYDTMESLQEAFDNENAVAVVLNADSGGGSPSQSDLIYNEILRLKAKHPEKKTYAVIGDVCASGCYYIVSAVDTILANKTSMIGSIGVKMEGFGFTGLMDKLGVERRNLIAGEFKTLADPFSPVNIDGTNFLKHNIVDKTHEVFIGAVKEGRGNRLKVDDLTFSGLVWVGEDALDKGLIDGFGDLFGIARDLTDSNNIHNYSKKKNSLRSLIMGTAAAVSSELGMSSSSGVNLTM